MTGAVTTLASLNYETKAQYTHAIEIRDNAGGANHLKDTATLDD